MHAVARSIASARLDERYLKLWENVVTGKGGLSDGERAILARALSRGICSSGTCSPTEVPERSDDHFKGHLVEVLLFSLRVHLANKGHADPKMFEPGHPKASPATPGIDLLEVGETAKGYYFHIWECKGTDKNTTSAMADAAAQLCTSNGTAYQGFMEAYKCLQENGLLTTNGPLASFVREMPRMFYDCPRHAAKRLGSAVATGTDHAIQHSIATFAEKVGCEVADGHPHCQPVVIRIPDFEHFRGDVFRHLWNIF